MSCSLWAVPSLQTWSQRSNLDPKGACTSPGRPALQNVSLSHLRA